MDLDFFHKFYRIAEPNIEVTLFSSSDSEKPQYSESIEFSELFYIGDSLTQLKTSDITVLIFKIPLTNVKSEYYIPQQDFIRLNNSKILNYLTIDFLKSKSNKAPKDVSEREIFAKMLQFNK
jgi:hypothetical protein